MPNERPSALVLMKFLDDHWRDETYLVISEVLEEAGYAVMRADQILSSGPVVDEVCRLIESVNLIVVDTTGDSHNVSYEIGYAHGAKRGFDSTIILRSSASGSTPFNYQHFRVLVYRDRRHLRRLLRERLSLSTPLLDSQVGLALNFGINKRGRIYGRDAAELALTAFRSLRFTGRCEYYAGDIFLPGEDSFYVVGLACKLPGRKDRTPDYDWWQRFLDSIPDSPVLTLNRDLSELGEISGLRANLLARGVVEFETGEPVSILNPEGSESDSWFISAVRERIEPKGSTEESPKPSDRADGKKRPRSSA